MRVRLPSRGGNPRGRGAVTVDGEGPGTRERQRHRQGRMGGSFDQAVQGSRGPGDERTSAIAMRSRARARSPAQAEQDRSSARRPRGSRRCPRTASRADRDRHPELDTEIAEVERTATVGGPAQIGVERQSPSSPSPMSRCAAVTAQRGAVNSNVPAAAATSPAGTPIPPPQRHMPGHLVMDRFDCRLPDGGAGSLRPRTEFRTTRVHLEASEPSVLNCGPTAMPGSGVERMGMAARNWGIRTASPSRTTASTVRAAASPAPLVRPPDADYERRAPDLEREHRQTSRPDRPLPRRRPTSSCRQFARGDDLLVAVRGGGHNVGGRALCDRGHRHRSVRDEGRVRRRGRGRFGSRWRDAGRRRSRDASTASPFPPASSRGPGSPD